MWLMDGFWYCHYDRTKKQEKKRKKEDFTPESHTSSGSLHRAEGPPQPTVVCQLDTVVLHQKHEGDVEIIEVDQISRPGQTRRSDLVHQKFQGRKRWSIEVGLSFCWFRGERMDVTLAVAAAKTIVFWVMQKQLLVLCWPRPKSISIGLF